MGVGVGVGTHVFESVCVCEAARLFPWHSPTLSPSSPLCPLPLQDLFSELDEDGSGTISFAELTAGLRRMGYTLSDNEIEMLMRRVDADNSGCVGCLLRICVRVCVCVHACMCEGACVCPLILSYSFDHLQMCGGE